MFLHNFIKLHALRIKKIISNNYLFIQHICLSGPHVADTALDPRQIAVDETE